MIVIRSFMREEAGGGRQEVTTINFKAIGLTRLGFELAKFGFPNFPKLETDALHIWPHHLVWKQVTGVGSGSEVGRRGGSS